MTGRPIRILSRLRRTVDGRRPHTLLPWWTLMVAVAASFLTFAVTRSGGTGLQVSPAQSQMISELESVLLYDSVVPQYDRVVNQYDSRGFVAGIGEFSTADGGTLDVVRTYTARVGDNELSRSYLPTLERLAAAHSGDVSGLVGFPNAWQRSSVDSVFRQVQVDVLNSREYLPALAQSEQLGLKSPLGLAIIYDSLMQHGAGASPDGLPVLISRTNARMGGSPRDVPERDWLRSFLDERLAMLLNPTDPVHRIVWPLTTGRVAVLSALLTAGREDLSAPIEVNPYGTPHIIGANTNDGDGPLPPAGSVGASPTTSRRAASGGPATPSSPPPVPGASATRPPAVGAGPPVSRTSPPPPAVVTPRPGLVVRLVNQTSRKAFGVADGSLDDGAAIVQSGDGSPAQQWRLTISGAGCFALINVRSGQALDDPNGSGDWGVQVQQWTADPRKNPNQAWCFDPAAHGLYSIRSLVSGLVLDLRDGQTYDDAAIQLWSATPGNTNQMWSMEVVA